MPRTDGMSSVSKCRFPLLFFRLLPPLHFPLPSTGLSMTIFLWLFSLFPFRGGFSFSYLAEVLSDEIITCAPFFLFPSTKPSDRWMSCVSRSRRLHYLFLLVTPSPAFLLSDRSVFPLFKIVHVSTAFSFAPSFFPVAIWNR